MCPTKEEIIEGVNLEDSEAEEAIDLVKETKADSEAEEVPSKVEDSEVLEEVESKITEKEFDRLTDKEKEKYGI